MTANSLARPEHKCLLSIDLDDLVIACAQTCMKPPPRGYRHRIHDDVSFTLDVLDQSNSKATFFVNAQYCENDGSVLEEIVARGHTIASHGFKHHDLRRISLQQFRDDLRRSLDVLQRYEPTVRGYRPPAFTMPYREEYFSIILDHGIEYISTGVGVSRSTAPACEVPVKLDCGIVHVPISTKPILGRRINYPIGYGVVARLMPQRLYLSTLESWIRHHEFFHFYCHTFEVAGFGRNRRVSLRDKWLSVTQGIYHLRCHNRHDFLSRIFGACRFEPIESWLRRRMRSD